MDSNASFYIAMNMHWESHTFFLPTTDKKSSWSVVFDTSGDGRKKIGKGENEYVLGPRTIVVFEEIPGPDKQSNVKKRT